MNIVLPRQLIAQWRELADQAEALANQNESDGAVGARRALVANLRKCANDLEQSLRMLDGQLSVGLGILDRQLGGES